jgi:ribosomal protein S18 acetylase RimI-like enzyme
MTVSHYTFRYDTHEHDMKNVREIIESTGFFYDFEIDVAVELVEERIKFGIESDYYFVFAEHEGKTVGYTCFGPIPCTKQSFDIYWIAVHNNSRGKGLGALLLAETERIINEMGGNGIYLETSSREKYLPTRNFYLKCDYAVESQVKDFYDYDDDKVVFVKRLRNNG